MTCIELLLKHRKICYLIWPHFLNKKKKEKKKNNGLLGTVLKDQVNTIINQTLLPHFNRTLSSNKIQELPEAVFANLNSLFEL